MGELREILPEVAVTRTVLDFGCVAGGGVDEPPPQPANNGSNMPTTTIAQRDFIAAFFHRSNSNGNGDRIIAKRGSERPNCAACF